MANEFKHKSAGASLTQAEDDNVDRHQFDSQAQGDIMIATSATQLSRLAPGTAGHHLVTGGAAANPSWGNRLVQTVEAHTGDDTLTRAESGSLHTNLGAGAAVTLTLPQDALAGDFFDFAVMAVQQLRIDPGAAGGIYINGAKQTDDLYVWADDEAESVRMVADGNGDWVALFANGTWTVEV